MALSVVGYAGLVWIALAPVAALATRRSVLGVTALTAACVWAADLLALGVKVLADRPRPFEVLVDVDPLLSATVGQSLPSGHAATSAAGATILTAVAPRAGPALVLLALGVAFSRIYVGVHYPMDVLVGGALGVAVAALGLWLWFRRPRRRAGSPPRRSRAPRSG